MSRERKKVVAYIKARAAEIGGGPTHRATAARAVGAAAAARQYRRGNRAGIASVSAPSRPALRYFGGKWKLAPFIVSHFPQHRTYLEPFGGAASVLLHKPRSHAEVYNDLDGDLVNLFRVLRDPQAAGILVELLRLTPFARAELLAAYEPTDDPVERARRLIVRSFQGFGSNPTRRAPRTGFRSALSQSGTTPARDWVNYPRQHSGDRRAVP